MTIRFRNFDRAADRVALFLFAVLVVVCIVATGCSKEHVPDDTLVIETDSGAHSIVVEVARTPEEKSRGLMFRTKLDPGHGMLFPYDAPLDASMWMRNTYISLDMVFIAADGRVARVAQRTEPLSDTIVNAGAMVTGVLEIGAGEAARLSIKSGDQVRHSHFKHGAENGG